MAHLSRRHWIKGAVASGLSVAAAPAWSAPTRRVATPEMTAGPFYPRTIPNDHDADLVAFGGRTARGEIAVVSGVLRDRRGRPVVGGAVEIWQCDVNGIYHHVGDDDEIDEGFQGFGACMTDTQGRFRFRTIRPAPYGGRTPHIHVKAKSPSSSLTTQWFDADQSERNRQDFLYRSLPSDGARQRLTLRFERTKGTDGAVGASTELVLP